MTRTMPWADTAVLLDTRAKRKMTSAELISRTGLDWEVGQHPLEANVHGKKVKLTDRVAMVREDSNEVLGVTSLSYEPFQNAEVFSFADKLVADGEARYVAGGQLKGGRQIFAVMELSEEMTVGKEDLHKLYLFLKTAHDGTGAIGGYLTPVRFVCTNVMTQAVKQATHKFAFRHTRDAREKIAEAHSTLNIAQTYAAAFKEQADVLLTLKVSDDDAETVFDAAIPHYLKNREERVLDMMATYRGSETNGYAGTGWGVFNAVTEHYDHVRSNRGTGEARITATLGGGETAKVRDRATAALLALV